MIYAYLNVCEFCGAKLIDYHTSIEKCSICETLVKKENEILAYERNGIVREYEREKYDQYLRHLVHKRITNIFWDRDDIEFVCVNSSYTFVTDADCCNKVWIEHVEGMELVLGHTVRDVERKTEGVEESVDGDGVEEAITYTLHTTGGFLDIELRNNHNGYYGGRLHLSGKEKLNEK